MVLAKQSRVFGRVGWAAVAVLFLAALGWRRGALVQTAVSLQAPIMLNSSPPADDRGEFPPDSCPLLHPCSWISASLNNCPLLLWLVMMLGNHLQVMMALSISRSSWRS